MIRWSSATSVFFGGGELEPSLAFGSPGTCGRLLRARRSSSRLVCRRAAASPPDLSAHPEIDHGLRRAPPRGRTPRSPSLLPFLQVLADDVEEALPALPLVFYPIRGLRKRLRPQGEAVGPAVNHAAHDARLLQQLQVP